jgi:hypothetical protein
MIWSAERSARPWRQSHERHGQEPGAARGFDLGLMQTMQLTPQGPQAEIAYILVVSCRSPLVAPPRIAAPAVIADAWPAEPHVAAAVAEALEGLADLRRQLLTTPSGQGMN